MVKKIQTARIRTRGDEPTTPDKKVHNTRAATRKQQQHILDVFFGDAPPDAPVKTKLTSAEAQKYREDDTESYDSLEHAQKYREEDTESVATENFLGLCMKRAGLKTCSCAGCNPTYDPAYCSPKVIYTHLAPTIEAMPHLKI